MFKNIKNMAKETITQKLRIKISSYDVKTLDLSAEEIIKEALKNDAKVSGPIPLPTKRKLYTVLRSSFVYKDAREQFEKKEHRRLIYILDPSSKIIESLTKLSLPNGISVDVKIV